MVANVKLSGSWLAAFATAGLLVGIASTANAGAPNASATLTFAQSGSDVLATVTGNAFSSALTYVTNSSTSFDGFVTPGVAYIGATGSSKSQYSGLTYDNTSTPFSSFKTGISYAASASGDVFGVSISGPNYRLHLPGTYTDGTTLSGSATFTGTTLVGMGLGAGTYRWTYGTSNQHEVKIVVSAGGTTGGGTTGGGGAVPEPGEWAAMGVLGAGLTGLVLRKRRKA
jgi:hypothetical protein